MKTDIENVIDKYLKIYPEENKNLEKLKLLLKHNKESYENLFNRKIMKGILQQVVIFIV